MNPCSIYFGFKQSLYRHIGAKVYTIWVHGPLGKQIVLAIRRLDIVGHHNDGKDSSGHKAILILLAAV